jgi:hypothetical protein
LSGGGRGGIRTHGTLAGTPVFKTGALNHSATLPDENLMSEGNADCKRQPRASGHVAMKSNQSFTTSVPSPFPPASPCDMVNA